MGVNSRSSILLLVNKKMYKRLHIHIDYLPLVHKESHKKLPIHGNTACDFSYTDIFPFLSGLGEETCL